MRRVWAPHPAKSSNRAPAGLDLRCPSTNPRTCPATHGAVGGARPKRGRGRVRSPSFHTLRHHFATPLLEHCVDIRTVQESMGRSDVLTAMIYLHMMKRPRGAPPVAGAPSPLDYNGNG